MSEADPVVPKYGPLILNPYQPTITLFKAHLQNSGPILQIPLNKVTAHTTGMLQENLLDYIKAHTTPKT